MTPRRFFVEPEAVSSEQVLLSAELVHHIGKVLRLSVGDELLLLDGRGNHYSGRIEELAAERGSFRIIEQWFADENILPIQLLQALPKGEKFDLILQKGVELGISRFSPVWSERSIPVMNRQRSEKKLQRWQRLVSEAARQSRRPVLPICDPANSLELALSNCRQELKLLLWEEESRPLADLLPAAAPADVAILVGPEGGFSRDEVAMARAAGFLPVSLGPRILRTETAGFAVTAVLEYLYGDFGSGNNAVL